MFWNLIKNAIKFSEPGGEVTVATEDAGAGRLRVLVRDGGMGITPEVLPRLFNAFEQGDPSMTTEHAFYVARELRARGIRRITGNLIVKGPYYCNYSTNRAAAGGVLIAALDVERWNGSIEYSFGRFQVQTRQASF